MSLGHLDTLGMVHELRCIDIVIRKNNQGQTPLNTYFGRGQSILVPLSSYD